MGPKTALFCPHDPTTFPILRQIYLVHELLPHLIKVIFILSMLTSSNWSLFRKGFPIRNPYRFFFLPIRATRCTLPIHFHLIIQITPDERYKSWNYVIFSSELRTSSLKKIVLFKLYAISLLIIQNLRKRCNLQGIFYSNTHIFNASNN